MSEAFPRMPAPRHEQPNPEHIAQARHDYEHHVPSRVAHRMCLAEGCTEWPCPPYRHAVSVLERAGLIKIDGSLRESDPI
ncbi:MAG: hypothetical protein ACRDTU_14950 [Micromonosporaceae bacterium]